MNHIFLVFKLYATNKTLSNDYPIQKYPFATDVPTTGAHIISGKRVYRFLL